MPNKYISANIRERYLYTIFRSIMRCFIVSCGTAFLIIFFYWDEMAPLKRDVFEKVVGSLFPITLILLIFSHVLSRVLLSTRMGKKVKCKDCFKMMEWAMPQRVTATNYEAAKDFLVIAKRFCRFCACTESVKGKCIEKEHSCSKFRRIDELSKRRYEGYLIKRVAELEKMIKEHETTVDRAEIKEEIS